MSKAKEFYYSSKVVRTLDEMQKMCQKKTNNDGCIHPPLLHIDQEHVVVDELHLLLRITDVLLRNVIEDAVRLDQKVNLGKRSNSVKTGIGRN